ncbi:MAG: sulfur carrier protein ThiS [Chloroflexota bacterium]
MDAIRPLVVTVNRQAKQLGRPMNLPEALETLGIAATRIAIARNGEVVPRERWSETIVQDGDTLDVVRAVSGGAAVADDPLVIAGRQFRSRLFLGTGRFPSPHVLRQALAAAETELVTVSIRALGLDGQNADGGLLDELASGSYHLLPNTAGATTVRQAVYMAHLAREVTGTNWVKLEVIGDERTLWPDPTGTVEACRQLVADGFIVLPYTSLDFVTALRLEEAGASAVMPMAAMIGSGQGMQDAAGLRRIVDRLTVPIVVDAGIGTPSDATIAMEQGAAACLVNTAISLAQDPCCMAEAMRLAVCAGRLAYRAGRMPRLEYAVPSSPPDGVPAAPTGRVPPEPVAAGNR